MESLIDRIESYRGLKDVKFIIYRMIYQHRMRKCLIYTCKCMSVCRKGFYEYWYDPYGDAGRTYMSRNIESSYYLWCNEIYNYKLCEDRVIVSKTPYSNGK